MYHKVLSIPIPETLQRVTGSRSSWVERFEHGGQAYFLKTYIYSPPFGPLRGLFRNTFLAASRVAREWRALRVLAAANLQPDLAVDRSERRILGFLLEARLLTRDFGGEDLERRLRHRTLDRRELSGLARFVRGLHDTGLRDPDLKGRNLLISGRHGSTAFAKIDASSSYVRTGGPRWDRHRLRDLQVLLSDLAAHGQPARSLLRLAIGQWFPAPRPALLSPAAIRRLSTAVRGVASPARS